MTSSPRFPPLDMGVRFNDDGSGFPAFERAADQAFSAVESRQRRFNSNMDAAQKSLAGALAGPRNSLGALDLNVSGLQNAAVKAEQAAVAARELASATRLAATAAGDNSTQARLQVAAMEAVAREHEQAAQAARSHAAAMEQVQQQLNRTAGAATKLSITGPGMNMAMQAGAAGATRLLRSTFAARRLRRDPDLPKVRSELVAATARDCYRIDQPYSRLLLVGFGEVRRSGTSTPADRSAASCRRFVEILHVRIFLEYAEPAGVFAYSVADI